MSKTLVKANHAEGPLPNGSGGCYARHAEQGRCPGVKVAEWLNALGDDDAPYFTNPDPAVPHPTTNGQVRANWLRSFDHITKA